MPYIIDVLVMALLLSGNPQQPAERPIVDAPVMSDYFDAPSTVEGFVSRSDVVVVARATAARDVSRGHRQKTEYEVDVIEVIKGNVKRGEHATVCRGIGTREHPDKIVRIFEPGFPSFDVGREYLLFLKWDANGGCYWPAFGRMTAAPFDAEGRLKPFSRSGVIERLKGLSRAEVVARLSPPPHAN